MTSRGINTGDDDDNDDDGVDDGVDDDEHISSGFRCDFRKTMSAGFTFFLRCVIR
jgi:hypothetical protein